jgi:NADH-quinone oxidoreductase subunit M
MVGAATYALLMMQRVFFGAQQNEAQSLDELEVREWFTLTALAVLTIVLGVYPAPVLELAEPVVQNLLGLSLPEVTP